MEHVREKLLELRQAIDALISEVQSTKPACPACVDKRMHAGDEYALYHPAVPTVDNRKSLLRCCPLRYSRLEIPFRVAVGFGVPIAPLAVPAGSAVVNATWATDPGPLHVAVSRDLQYGLVVVAPSLIFTSAISR
jgi:hypothetical protein